MQIIIDIPEDSYKATCNGWMLPTDVENVVEAIKNGTLLPNALEYLETSYAGARACDDVAEQVRLARAIEAYKQDVHEDCTVLDAINKTNKTYCTECHYFTNVPYEGEQWFGARCKKDGHSTMPSMYAIKSLHNDCPLVTEIEPQESEE